MKALYVYAVSSGILAACLGLLCGYGLFDALRSFGRVIGPDPATPPWGFPPALAVAALCGFVVMLAISTLLGAIGATIWHEEKKP